MRNDVAGLVNISDMSSLARKPGAKPGQWFQKFFLDVFMLYRYCSL